MKTTTLVSVRRRIRSVRNTQQITKAMEMVAGARLRKIERKIHITRSYGKELNRILLNVLPVLTGDESPLLVSRPQVKRICFVVMGADRGLCGAFNTNIIRYAEQFIAEKGKEAKVVACGRKMVRHFQKRPFELLMKVSDLYRSFSLPLTDAITKKIVESFENGSVDEVYVIAPRFINVMQHSMHSFKILPLSLPTISKELEAEKVKPSKETEERVNGGYELEPDTATLCHHLLKEYISHTLFKWLLETLTSEAGARMVAMRKASDNAQSVIDTLSLEYNQARQRSITAELLDIVGTVEALK
ncbi:MAG: ATP synthase F1 subunit gamma [Planctomycetota bacterium]|nr:ATP synthase F1 subunit gamma [Planctomycetota bacterium]